MFPLGGWEQGREGEAVGRGWKIGRREDEEKWGKEGEEGDEGGKEEEGEGGDDDDDDEEEEEEEEKGERGKGRRGGMPLGVTISSPRSCHTFLL